MSNNHAFQVRLALGALLLIGVFSTGFLLSGSRAIGKTVSNFTLQNIDGKYVSLSDYKTAKGFIVVFTCNHCPFAKLYSGRLNALNATCKPLGVPLLAVNSMDTTVYEEEHLFDMQAKAKSEQFNFPYLQDKMQKVGKDFGADHTPHAFVIWQENKQWRIKYSGGIDDNGANPASATPFVAEAVDQLLQNKPVARPETRSVGCAISYRK
ncbi:MAG: thioredoxin family protein [Bacteroidota bacterium]